MIDLRAIAVRLRDEAERDAQWWERHLTQDAAPTWRAIASNYHRDIATLDGIARAVTEAGEVK